MLTRSTSAVGVFSWISRSFWLRSECAISFHNGKILLDVLLSLDSSFALRSAAWRMAFLRTLMLS